MKNKCTFRLKRKTEIEINIKGDMFLSKLGMDIIIGIMAMFLKIKSWLI
jgi:hypothetical protein